MEEVQPRSSKRIDFETWNAYTVNVNAECQALITVKSYFYYVFLMEDLLMQMVILKIHSMVEKSLPNLNCSLEFDVFPFRLGFNFSNSISIRC